MTTLAYILMPVISASGPDRYDRRDAMPCDAMSGRDPLAILIPRLASSIVSAPLRLIDPCTEKKLPSTNYMLLGRFDHPQLRCSRRPDASDAQRHLVDPSAAMPPVLQSEQDKTDVPTAF